MADRLESFNRSLQEDIRNRRAQETARHQQLQDMVLKLEAEVLAEGKRRELEDQKVRALIDRKVAAVAERLEQRFTDLQVGMEDAFEGVHRQLAELSGALRQEVETRQTEAKILARAVLERVDILGKKTDDERVERLEAESRTISKVATDMRHMQEGMDAERASWEDTVRRLEGQLKDAVAGHLSDTDVSFKAVFEEFLAIRAQLEAEKAARAAGDEALGRDLEVHTDRLQQALRMIQQAMHG